MQARHSIFTLVLACFLAVFAYSANAVESANDPYYTDPAAQAAESPGTDAANELASDPLTDESLAENPAGDHSGDHGDAKAEKKGLPQFDPSSFTSQVFWLVIMFVVLYFFFSKVTFPQVSAIQHKRKARIDHDIATAQKMRESAELAKSKYETAAAEAQVKSTAIYKKAAEENKIKFNETLDAFRARGAKLVQDTESQISNAKSQSMESIQMVAASTARVAAEKIVGISTNDGEARSVIQNLNRKAA
jgi:F-type H+-transporting ATPase subunit b